MLFEPQVNNLTELVVHGYTVVWIVGWIIYIKISNIMNTRRHTHNKSVNCVTLQGTTSLICKYCWIQFLEMKDLIIKKNNNENCRRLNVIYLNCCWCNMQIIEIAITFLKHATWRCWCMWDNTVPVKWIHWKLLEIHRFRKMILIFSYYVLN